MTSVQDIIGLMTLNDQLSARYTSAMAIDDLTGSQALILLRMGEKTISKMGAIAEVYFGTNQSYCIDKLEKLGYLTKVEDKTDRRVKSVALTKKGLELRLKLIERNSILCDKFDDDVFQILTSCLRQLDRSLWYERFKSNSIGGEDA